MSNQHKHPTISFRISDAERKQIEARILASGMMKKDYFVRSCIYNRICVVGKKENIYPLVQTINALYLQLLEMQQAFIGSDADTAIPNTLDKYHFYVLVFIKMFFKFIHLIVIHNHNILLIININSIL